MSQLNHQENVTVAQALATPPSWTKAEIPMPLRRHDIRIYQIDGEAVLFDPKTHKILQLNVTALAVFRRCDGQTTMRQVAESLTDSFNVTFDIALDQVEQLVGLFAASSLLVLEDGA